MIEYAPSLPVQFLVATRFAAASNVADGVSVCAPAATATPAIVSAATTPPIQNFTCFISNCLLGRLPLGA